MIFWLLIRVVAWLVVDDSDIARIIISDSSESEGKQMKVPFCRNHGCFGGLWFHWKWTSLCTAKTCLDLAIHWYTEKRGKSGMFLLLPFLQYSLAFLRQTVMRPCQFSLYWKLSYAYLGARVFKLSSRIFLRLYILVIPCSNLVAKGDCTFIGNRCGVFIRVVICVVVSYIWIFRLGEKQRRRSVLLLLLMYYLLRFIIDGWPVRCSRFLLYRSFLVIFWRESSTEADSKWRYRRLR